MSSHFVPHTKIPTLVFSTSTQASRHVAVMIESLIRQKQFGRPGDGLRFGNRFDPVWSLS